MITLNNLTDKNIQIYSYVDMSVYIILSIIIFSI